MDRMQYDSEVGKAVMAIRKQATSDALEGFTDNPKDPDNTINAVIAGVDAAVVISLAVIEGILFN